MAKGSPAMGGLAFLVALITSPVATRAAAPGAPLLTPDATVVVLSGLPGDLEHERAYESHLTRLLSILAAPGVRPRRVMLLLDAPPKVPLPPALGARTGLASRDAFVALGRELAGEPGPLVVVAWGHGGAQGATPVFHVRGPRLTPADFASFAGGPPGRVSRWMLLFRGSGAFARALRDASREILSSENEAAFRDEPIGMELLLSILRDDPRLDLERAGERLGPAVASWYADKGLARTEEPTLWTGSAAPRPLAAAVGAAADAVAAPPAERLAPVADAPAPPTPSPSAGWEGIEPVEPSRLPGAPAVVLRRRETYTIGQSPALTHEVDQFVQVLTEDGVSFGDVDVSHSPPEEKLAFLDCEVRQPDGHLQRLPPGDIHPAGAPALPGPYRVPARSIFSLPGVRPGAILRVHYRSEWARFPLPHVLLELPLAGEAAMLGARIEIRVPTGSAFHWTFRDAPGREPEVVTTTYGTSYAWTIGETPARAHESLSPPDAWPRLLVSTFPDWPSFGAWYQRLIQHASEVTPEIAAEAERITRGARTDLEKVRAVYHYVTRLRYVAIPLGVNSHRPHAASGVLRNGFGDCKDKANLFNTLLRALGLEADLVLVPRFTQAFDEVPGLAFNHALSRVRLGGEVLWIDTTDDNCPFGLLPPGDPGRSVLVVEAGVKGLRRLPAPDPAAHRLDLEGTLAAEVGAPARLQARAAGYADYALRAAAREAAGHASRPVLAEAYRPSAGLFLVSRQAHTPVKALEEPFTWTGEGSWVGLATRLPDGRRLQRAPFWIPQEWESALQPRRSRLFLNQGYPLALEQTFTIALPAGATRVTLPPPRASAAGPLRFRLEWAAAGPEVKASLRVDLPSGELDDAQTAPFQQALRELMTALGEGAVYEAGTP